MTFEEYIKNPMGKKASVMTNRQIYDKMYSDKWDKLMVRENGIISHKLYVDKDDYYAHFKIPSEVVPKFYYDVVVRFFIPVGKTKGIIRSLSQYDVQFYSNEPNFVFTFAHAFKKHKMLIKDLELKMSAIALKEKAAEKNPKDELGYDKSLYFTYIAMKSLNLFSRSQWEIAYPYTKTIWASTVTHADDKVRDRIKFGQAIAKKEKINQKKETSSDHNQNRSNTVKFASPNIKDFGHFKKINYNSIGKSKPKSQNGIKKFKKKLFK